MRRDFKLNLRSKILYEVCILKPVWFLDFSKNHFEMSINTQNVNDSIKRVKKRVSLKADKKRTSLVPHC